MAAYSYIPDIDIYGQVQVCRCTTKGTVQLSIMLHKDIDSPRFYSTSVRLPCLLHVQGYLKLIIGLA